MLMPQKFKGFNDLCTKAHDIENHLNKRSKKDKESSGKTGCLLAKIIALWEKAVQYNAGSSSSNKSYPTNGEAAKKTG